MDLPEFFLAQHAQSHAAAMSGATEPQWEDQVLAGLADEQLRLRPAEGLNSIAWLLWHLARSEDVTVGVLLTGRGQVLDEGEWPADLGVARRDMGTGATAAQVAEVGAGLRIAGVRAYRAAVGGRTREVARGLRADEWDGPIAPERLLAAGAFPDPADGARRVATYWSGKTRRDVLGSLATHNFQHLGEATCIKSLIVRGVREADDRATRAQLQNPLVHRSTAETPFQEK